MKTYFPGIRQYLPVITLCLLTGIPVLAAPVAPDAGQTIREIQKPPELKAPKVDRPLRVEDESAIRGATGNDARIKVEAIRVSGNSIFTSVELETLVTNLAGGIHSLAELDAGAARITAWYREHGYVVARAYLPAQDIKDGVVVINVLEGLIGQHRINNPSRLSDEMTDSYLRDIRSGEVLQAQQINRALLLLGDTPGVGGIHATLQPGASVGTSDLLIELDPGKPYTANLELDNYGNRYIGEYRMGGALALNSPLKIGDQLSLRAVASNENMSYLRLAYQLPMGGGGLKFGGAYADTRYHLSMEFAALRAHGRASSSSLYVTYPFIRSQLTNLSGTLTWENKKLLDQTDAPASSLNKQVQLVNVGLSGNHQDALWDGGASVFDASLVTGKLGMDATSLAADAVSARSNGTYSRLAYNVNRIQRLSERDMLSLAISGQQTSKNLNSSEKFALGGANGVRAYPQGEGNGDQGWMANLEARHSLTEKLQGVLFYDTGSVTINRNAFAAGANTRNISGAGMGVNANLAGAQIKACLAWRTGGGQPLSVQASVDRSPRLWMQLTGQF